MDQTELRLQAFNLHFIDKLTIKATADILGVEPILVLTLLGLKKPFNLQKHKQRLKAQRKKERRKTRKEDQKRLEAKEQDRRKYGIYGRR